MSDSSLRDPDKPDAGGGDAAMDGLTRGRAWLVGGAVGAVMLAALVIAFVIGTNYSDDPSPIGAGTTETTETTADTVTDTTDTTATTTETTETTTAAPLPKDLSGPGKEAFATSCGSCHALSDAGTSSPVGPNLDNLAPSAQMVEDAIANGGAGTGMMPPGLLSGEQAKQVAEYIAAATGGG